MRRPLLAAAAALSLAAAGAAAPPRVALPRDHYPHAHAKIEWWYFTGIARDPAGSRYSFFFTLFKSGPNVVPVSQVVDLTTGALVGHTEQVGTVPSGRGLDIRAGGSRLALLPSGSWSFSATSPAYGITLTLKPEKPYVLHGGGSGVIAQSTGGSSSYYSDTRLAATGSLRAGTKTVRLSGEGWFDHQWGDFTTDPAAFDWDWFACRLDDGRDLMLYQFRDRETGKPLARYRSGTLVAKDGSSREVTTFTATPGPSAFTGDGRAWPLDWTLSVPAAGVELRLYSETRDQLVRGKVLPTFWEGAAQATGSATGSCFVEQSYR